MDEDNINKSINKDDVRECTAEIARLKHKRKGFSAVLQKLMI